MNDAAVAIEGNEYVAILGIQIGRDFFGQETEKRVVFRQKAGDKRLSSSNLKMKFHASSRRWSNITNTDPVWEEFKQLVGAITTTVTYSRKDL